MFEIYIWMELHAVLPGDFRGTKPAYSSESCWKKSAAKKQQGNLALKYGIYGS